MVAYAYCQRAKDAVGDENRSSVNTDEFIMPPDLLEGRFDCLLAVLIK